MSFRFYDKFEIEKNLRKISFCCMKKSYYTHQFYAVNFA